MDEVLDSQDLIQRLPPYFTGSFLARRNSGKSTLIADIIQELIKAKRVDMVIVMTGSAGLGNGDYACLPSKLVMPFDENKLKKMWEIQKATPAEERQHLLIVIDDALATPEAINNPTINTIFSLGRHAFTSCFLASQHTKSLCSPLIKTNSDIIVFSKLSRSNYDIIHECTTHISKQDFIKICERIGGHHWNFVVLDNYKQTTDPAEYITIVRAKAPK
jgi:hypothetical protein